MNPGDSPAFIKNLDELLEISPESLVRREALGEIDFSKGLTLLRRYFYFLSELRNIDYDQLPNGKVNEIGAVIRDAALQIEAIRNFTLNANYPQGPAVFRDQLLDNLDSQFTDSLGRLAPAIAYARRHDEDLSVRRAALESEIAHARELSEEQQRIRDEAVGVLTAIKTAAGETGVANNASYFEAEVTEQRRGQRLWLIASAAAAAVTLIAALYSASSYVDVVSKLNTQASIQIGIAKLAAISVLYFVLVTCTRNYMATTHNVIVNRHRRNALQTFEAFVKASKDDATRDAVLLRATEAIFAPEVSGYLRAEGDAKVAQPQFFEFFRPQKDG